MSKPLPEGAAGRLAFLNTRMPSDSFLARDLVALSRLGVVMDLYVLDPGAISASLRAAIEAAGGSVRRLDSPVAPAALFALLRELVLHPTLLLQSIGLSFRTMGRNFEEGVRALAVIGSALAVGRRMASDGTLQVHGLWAGVPTTVALWVHRHFGLPFSFSGHAYDLNFQTVLLPTKAKEACAIVVCSRFAREKLSAFMPVEERGRIRVVRHGLDLREWDRSGREGRSPAGSRIILAVGRLTEKKGYRYLVEACAQLRQRGLAFECHIVGPDVGLGQDLARHVAALGLGNQVQLVGTISNDAVRERMARATVLAVPSIEDRHGDSDGVPNVVLEAMALGLPVVSTDVGGIAEAVQDGQTGFVVPQKDASALAGALERVLAGDRDLTTLGDQARELVEREFAVEKTSRLFLEAVAPARRDGLVPGPARP